MLKGSPNEWGLVISSVADGTRPAAAWGALLTPGNNTYGSYVQLLTATSDETYLIRIACHSFAASATARDALVTIGIDPAGGTSYADFIVDLAASCAPTYAQFIGIVEYEFPVRIPAGASVAAKATVNNATVGTGRVSITLFGRPSRPELVKAGTFVQTFGATPASSSGSTFTAGSTSEGAWAQVGSALTAPLWFWEFGFCVNNTVMGNTVHHVDIGLGDASNKKVVIPNGVVAESSAETLAKPAQGRFGIGAVGDIVYARVQDGPAVGGTPASVIVYGVGG